MNSNSEESFSPTARRDAVAGLYAVREVARLFGVSEGRLRYWDRSGFLGPSGEIQGRRAYTFVDLVAIRSAKTLLDGGLSLQAVRGVLGTLRERLPAEPTLLHRLRISADSGEVVLQDEQGEVAARTGQLLLDFSVRSLEDDVVAKLPPRTRDPEALDEPRTALEWYLLGCQLDECEETLGEAEAAYHRAIHLDPAMPNAYTNLGNVMFRIGAVEDARVLYQKAIELDPRQSEAQYNLGFLCFETGQLERAVECFRAAVRLDPTFADAHFNLATCLTRMGGEENPRPHWQRYLELEPTGPWADIARRHLGELG